MQVPRNEMSWTKEENGMQDGLWCGWRWENETEDMIPAVWRGMAPILPSLALFYFCSARDLVMLIGRGGFSVLT